VSFNLGPAGNPPVPSGGHIPASVKPDLFTTLVDRVDSTLIGTSGTFREMAELLQEPTSDLRETLASVANLTDNLAQILDEERRHISTILRNLEGTTGSLDTLTTHGADSLSAMIGDAREAIETSKQALEELKSLSSSLSSVADKIDDGQGSLGLLVNDQDLYRNLDSALVNLNRLLVDFRNNPNRYLKELKIVDLL
jgi:phospholipid/cholesterol/gamma-HCH transport system substrate-binding protein